MFRRTCVLGLILVAALYIIKCVVFFAMKVELAEFQPAGVIFLLDTSASNKTLQSRQEDTILKICKRLDSEDKSWIYIVTEDAYRIYNENPHRLNDIRKAFAERGQLDAKAYGTAYGLTLKKAVNDALQFKQEGYKPSIVVLGDLENEGDITKQINWDKLPANMEKTLKHIPELSLAFLYAHPKKLDDARDKLRNVIPENQLFFSSEENVDLTVNRFIKAIGR